MAALFVVLVLADIISSSYTIAGGFHADKDPALATNCIAGFKEFIHTILTDPASQQMVLCMAFSLFVLTTVNCYFTMSYLGLYGVFSLQLLTLVIFWLSLLLNFNTFILAGASAHLVFFK